MALATIALVAGFLFFASSNKANGKNGNSNPSASQSDGNNLPESNRDSSQKGCVIVAIDCTCSSGIITMSEASALMNYAIKNGKQHRRDIEKAIYTIAFAYGKDPLAKVDGYCMILNELDK